MGMRGTFLLSFPQRTSYPALDALVCAPIHCLSVVPELAGKLTFSIEQWPLLLVAPVQSVLLLAPVFSQIYRYRHMSNPVEKQQTKWVVFGIVLTLLGDVLLFLPPVFFTLFTEPGLPRSIYALVSECLFPALLPLIPITIGIALLRY